MAESLTRVGGSGLTVVTWNGSSTPLAMMQAIQDTAPAPVAQAVPVQPINSATPIEIVTARAVGAGTLRLTFYEQWASNVWELLPNFRGAHSLLDVLKKQLSLGSITIAKVIFLPGGGKRQKVYHNCVITDVDDGEQIQINTMVLPKGITVMYTDATII